MWLFIFSSINVVLISKRYKSKIRANCLKKKNINQNMRKRTVVGSVYYWYISTFKYSHRYFKSTFSGFARFEYRRTENWYIEGWSESSHVHSGSSVNESTYLIEWHTSDLKQFYSIIPIIIVLLVHKIHTFFCSRKKSWSFHHEWVAWIFSCGEYNSSAYIFCNHQSQ